MSFFSNLEKSLEAIIESTLMGRFRGRVQPIEIARALWREITADKRIGVSGVYVPNYFRINLSPEDLDYLENLKGTMEAEIIQYLKKETGRRDFLFVGPVVIQWISSEEVKEGSFAIDADFLEAKEMPTGFPDKTGAAEAKLPTGRRSGTLSTSKYEKSVPGGGVNAALIVSDGFDRGKEFGLAAGEYSIGRSDECDVTIGDPTVSKRHARIYFRNGSYFIEDSGSRKGVIVDGREVNEALLEDGSEIKIGMTSLHFRKGNP